MNVAIKLAKYLKPYWLWAVLAPLLMTLEVAMDLMQPRMIQRIVDQGIAQYDMDIIIQTALIMVGLALVGAVGGLAARFSPYWPHWALAPIYGVSSFVRYSRFLSVTWMS